MFRVHSSIHKGFSEKSASLFIRFLQSMSRKLAVISGGTRGIGRAIAEEFAKNNFDIVISARNEADLAEAKQNIEQTYGVKCFTQKADLSNKEQAIAFAEFVKSLNQPIGMLTNNAGTFIPGNVHEEADGVLEQLIETNLYSAYHLTRGLIPTMITQKSGHIFNICSVASLKAYPNGGSYSISKFALFGFSKVLREEMKNFGIKVTSIMPGAVYTDSWAGAGIPEERFMTVSDVAETIWSAYSLSKNAVIEDIVLRPQEGDI
ncbi:short-chain dehydrogenase/reductase SDR [Emticicia oligotrophica DSM 17448]|uniref:Short-chain dehydrogenase/reductase SDR n=2 Tax=Emticicia TaxID=312278 RepID=A0ABN4AKU9_EMTOG|nr:short-chain dehydrogenase/reductase SDR [Emticicia oligotrophica DSM 17448]